MTEAGQGGRAISLTDAQRLDWLRLIRSENVGPATFRDLINHFGSATTALEALPDLSRRGGKNAIRICQVSDAEAEYEALKRFGARLVALGEYGYPPHLRHIDGPPPLLTMVGGQASTDTQIAAVVGARNASLSGQKMASTIASELSQSGFVIVSGLARGIDRAAHEASLHGGTIAVFAGGIDVLYPAEHEGLAVAIANAGGTLISEMPFSWSPRGRDFPRRNRLISGMSLGVIVIEAARNSGSLHTARFALEQNRSIFVVPGSPLDPRSAGGNKLIQQGATLITGSRDILEVLEPQTGRPLPSGRDLEEPTPESGDPSDAAPGDKDRLQLLEALGPAPIGIDELIRFTGFSTRSVHIMLLELELAGRLERHSGQRVSLLM